MSDSDMPPIREDIRIMHAQRMAENKEVEERRKILQVEAQRKMLLSQTEHEYGENDAGQRIISTVVACILLLAAGVQLLADRPITALLTLIVSAIFLLISTTLRSRATTRAGNDRMLLELRALRESFDQIVKNQRPRGN